MTTWRLGRRPALDGLRGVAILLVLACHVVDQETGKQSVMGSTGVTAFFTLSGFLITSLLLAEMDGRGRVRLGRFYVRRARRLLPALVVMLAVMTALIRWAVGSWSLAQVAPPLLYASNWWMIAGHSLPYFSQTWSLAIEEHFYLVWPVALILVRRWRWGIETVCVAGITASVVTRFALWDEGAGSARVYFGSDTHADALLIGCLLAAVISRRGLPKVPAWMVLGCVGALLSSALFTSPVVGVVVAPTVVPWLMAAAIVGCCGDVGLLSGPVIRWFGSRSYALYLWHWPLIALLQHYLYQPGNPTGARVALLGVAMAALFSELSWRLVERPLLARRIVGSDPGGADVGAVPSALVDAAS